MSQKMKAIAYQAAGSAEVLRDVTLDRPSPTGRDILVEVAAVSVNPVDTKVRKGMSAEDGQWKVLGWDASGTVTAGGDAVTGFAVGDEVYYAGSLVRQGTNSQFHLVDERIVASKPKSLSHAQAAALPLTTLTAYEMLFDRLDVKRPVPGAAKAIVIVGGAGGVGSIAIQLARQLTDLTVIATASREETKAWVRDLGAHHVIDHTKPIAAEVKALGLGQPGFVFSTTQTDKHIAEIVELIAPQGRFGLIDDPETLDIKPFKRKSVSTHWEFMYTRPIFETEDMGEQGRLLAEVAGLIDAGKLRTTVSDVMGPIDAATLIRAHQLIETGRARGKLVLDGFPA